MADEHVKARKKKKKDRQVNKLGDQLLRGKFYVAQRLVDNVAKRKEVVLFGYAWPLPPLIAFIYTMSPASRAETIKISEMAVSFYAVESNRKNMRL